DPARSRCLRRPALAAPWIPGTSPGMTATPSAAIVGVDGNVAVGQVAGPHGGAALAHADVDGDVDLAALHVAGERRLVGVGPARAGAGDDVGTVGDRQAVAVGLLASLADGGDDAAPVGVLAGDGGLDEGRVGDREGDAPRRAIALGAAYGDGDELGHAL